MDNYNFEIAEKTYQKAFLYYKGRNGYPLNYREAIKLFLHAAKLNHSDAMNELGNIYKYGRGVEIDYAIALDWYYKAINADCKNAYAACNLGFMYYEGKGVNIDMPKAYEFFRAAVDLGLENTHSTYAVSCLHVGFILINYYKNYIESVPFFIDASQYGNFASAWHNLGWLCENNYIKSVEKSQVKATALGFYKKAAEQGRNDSMDSVGRLYVLAQMFDEACYWLEKAAANGYEPAKKRLKNVYFLKRNS